MLGKQRAQPDHCAIIEPQTASFRLFLRDFEPRLSPDTLHPLVVDDPALIAQQTCDPTLSIATILTRPCNVSRSAQFCIIWNLFVIALGGTWLANYLAGPAF